MRCSAQHTIRQKNQSIGWTERLSGGSGEKTLLESCKVQFQRGKKGKITSTEVGYLYSGKEGQQLAYRPGWAPKGIREASYLQGGLWKWQGKRQSGGIFWVFFCWDDTCSWAGGDKSSGRVEGVVGFRTRGDKSQIDAAGLEHQGGTKVMLCFPRS